MSLSQAEIQQLAVSAGFSANSAKTAAAIAMAESGGDPNAHNSKPPDDSYGLWQINFYGPLKNSRLHQFGITAPSAAFNPAENAHMAYVISNHGQNFSPWSTYNDGAYRKYLNNSGDGVGDLLGKIPGVSAVSSVADASAKGAQALVKTAEWISNPSNWLRILYVGGGAIVVTAGIVLIVRSTEAGQSAISTGKKAAKTGASIAAVAAA